jgi:hypothetical protein
MMEGDDEVSQEPAAAAAHEPLSRRGFLKVSMAGAALTAAGGLSACMPSPTARTPGALPKALALYRDSPNQGRRCAGCVHFIEPNACDIVGGEISPNGWCRYHKPGAGSMQGAQAQPTGSSGSGSPGY